MRLQPLNKQWIPFLLGCLQDKILTTRPTASEKLCELCKGEHSCRLEILGFGKKEIDEYIHCAFSDEQSQSERAKTWERG